MYYKKKEMNFQMYKSYKYKRVKESKISDFNRQIKGIQYYYFINKLTAVGKLLRREFDYLILLGNCCDY